MPAVFSADSTVVIGGSGLSTNLSTAALDVPAYADNLVVREIGEDPVGDGIQVINVLHNDSDFVRGDNHDSIWFEKIHIEPRSVDLGFVLSSQTFTVRIWNAYRHRSRTIDDIEITGTSGVSLASPPSLPQNLPATEQYSYTVQLEADGAPFIDNVIHWQFDPTELGETLTITGVRLVPMPFISDNDQPPSQSIGFLTDLLTAERGDEQRLQLRAVPQYGLEYTVTNELEIDAQLFQALLFGWQARAYGVPLWHDAQALASAVSNGQPVIPVTTQYRAFTVGGLAFLWRSPREWEVLTISEVNADNLVVTTDVANAWPQGVTYVMPMQLGRLTDTEEITWRDVDISSMRLRFTMEATLP